MDLLIDHLKNVDLEDQRLPIRQPKIVTNELLSEYVSDIRESSILALDCEGVDLGRDGSITIIQISTATQCYLFDVINLHSTGEVKIFLKDILEDEKKIKIVHDCTMDSDALQHHLDITLAGVHDTQAWDSILHCHGEKNLNDTLTANGCQPNIKHDINVYKVKEEINNDNFIHSFNRFCSN